MKYLPMNYDLLIKQDIRNLNFKKICQIII